MFAMWDRCNTFTLAWIMNTLSYEVRESVLWIDIASGLLKDLRTRYFQGDLFRVADLQEALFALKQGDLSITSYFTQLKILWEELANFRPIPPCACGIPRVCVLASIRDYRNKDYVVRSLHGLDEQYNNVCSQIMLMKPLPDIGEVFSLLTQQERQINGSSLANSRALVNFADSQSGGRGRGRGRTSGRSQPSRRSSTGRGQNNKSFVCSHCGRTGHLVDTCYRKHGFPPHFKFKGNVNNIIVDDEIDETGSIAS